MDRYCQANTLVDAPVVPGSNAGGFPADGRPDVGVPGTVPGAWWYHAISEELRNAIAALGVSPDYRTVDQLAQGLVAALAKNSAFVQAGISAVQRTSQGKARERVSPYDFGAIGDGNVHPLSERFATLAAARAVYPFAVALTDQTDWAAIQSWLLQYLPAIGMQGGELNLNTGSYVINRPVTVTSFGSAIGGGGTGKYGTRITLTDDFAGEAALVYRNDAAYGFPGVLLKNLTLDCNNVAAHGIVGYSLYDQIDFPGVSILNVNGSFNALRLVPGVMSTVSQTVLVQNLYCQHFDTTGTAPTIYAEQLQEATFINCKAFGGPVTSARPARYPLHLRDCRGVTWIGGALATSSVGGALVEAVARRADSITFITPTIENIAGPCIVSRGADPANSFVRALTVIQPRLEDNQGGGTPGGVSTTNTANSRFDLSNLNVASTLGAGTTACLIEAFSYGNVTDNGANNTIITRRNAVDPYIVVRQLRVRYANTPLIELAVDGRSGVWQWAWSASSAADYGARFKGPGGAIPLMLGDNAGAGQIGFFNTGPYPQQTITGSRGGNAALADLLKKLASYGLVIDNTTA